jgi:hypothetical protein
MTVYPPSATADARNRAWRTFLQGLLVDIVLSVVAAASLAVSSPDFAWNGPYLLGVGLALAKTALTTMAAYVMRKLAPPAP